MQLLYDIKKTLHYDSYKKTMHLLNVNNVWLDKCDRSVK